MEPKVLFSSMVISTGAFSAVFPFPSNLSQHALSRLRLDPSSTVVGITFVSISCHFALIKRASCRSVWEPGAWNTPRLNKEPCLASVQNTCQSLSNKPGTGTLLGARASMGAESSTVVGCISCQIETECWEFVYMARGVFSMILTRWYMWKRETNNRWHASHRC